jgi:glycosyltransferase involved in cell wall biosynthesis
MNPGSKLLRVALFAVSPETNAATRIFCQRPVAYLKEEGIQANVFLPATRDVADRLLGKGVRGRRLRAALYWYGFVAPRRIVQILKAPAYDVVFIQAGLFRYNSPPVLELALRMLCGLLRTKVIYHLDDALWNVSRPSYYRKRLALADLVLTGNREIAEFASAVNPRVRLFDGMVEPDRYPVKQHGDKTPVVIGWVGHFPRERVGLVRDALLEVVGQGNAHIKVVSDEPYEDDELRESLSFECWSLEREFELFGDFDIGIMPLADTPYNRGKEAFKIKEYMAAGLPVVCSPIGHNRHVVRHGETGFFAETKAQWVTHLRRLVDDACLRQTLGTNGRRVVAERYALKSQIANLAAHMRDAHQWTGVAKDKSRAPVSGTGLD